MPPRSVRGFRPAVVRALREQHGWSLADLGERLGVARSQVWQWEDGRTVPTASRLAELAQMLGVDPYELLAVDPANPTLHDLRVRRGLSAKDLADRAGLPYESVVHSLDLGRRTTDPPDDVVRKLADALDVGEDEVRRACRASREERLGQRSQG
jgi:transcriptional regulator with XRE-family HTH domain